MLTRSRWRTDGQSKRRTVPRGSAMRGTTHASRTKGAISSPRRRNTPSQHTGGVMFLPIIHVYVAITPESPRSIAARAGLIQVFQRAATIPRSDHRHDLYTGSVQCDSHVSRRRTAVCNRDHNSIPGTSRPLLTWVHVLRTCVLGCRWQETDLHLSRYFGQFREYRRFFVDLRHSVQRARIRRSTGLEFSQSKLENVRKALESLANTVCFEQPLFLASCEVETVC